MNWREYINFFLNVREHTTCCISNTLKFKSTSFNRSLLLFNSLYKKMNWNWTNWVWLKYKMGSEKSYFIPCWHICSCFKHKTHLWSISEKSILHLKWMYLDLTYLYWRTRKICILFLQHMHHLMPRLYGFKSFCINLFSLFWWELQTSLVTLK